MKKLVTIIVLVIMMMMMTTGCTNNELNDETLGDHTGKQIPTSSVIPTTPFDLKNEDESYNGDIIANKDTVFFGHYEQDGDESNGIEPIEWIVLFSDEEKMILLSKYGLDYKQFNPDNSGYCADWNGSFIRAWLNEDFYSIAFNEEEKNYLIPSENETRFMQYDSHFNMSMTSGDTSIENVFLLSVDEVTNVGYGFKADMKVKDIYRKCTATAYAKKVIDDIDAKSNEKSTWWTRTTIQDYSDPVLSYGSVDVDGIVTKSYNNTWNIVRPAIVIRNVDREIAFSKINVPKPQIDYSEKTNISDITPTTVPSIIEDEVPITEDVSGIDYSTMYFTMDSDIYADFVEDFYCLSIDGQLIEFPCTYDYLLSKFGKLYDKEIGRFMEEYIDLDEKIEHKSYTIYAIPTTGAGEIAFQFRSANNDGTKGTIKELMCQGVTITGGTYNVKEKTMLLTLPKKITFGASTADIMTAYYSPKKENKNLSNNFWLCYKTFSGDDIEINFWGRDEQLYMVSIEFNASKRK